MSSKIIMPVRNKNVKETKFVCQQHGKTIYELNGSMMCIDCAKLITDAATKDANAKLIDTLKQKHANGAMIPKRLINKGFKGYLVEHEGMLNAQTSVWEFAKSVAANGTSNMIMVGACGTGKTHLGVAAVRYVVSKGFYARYVNSADMATEIADAWSRADDSEFNAIYRFADYKLLVIDEYGLHDRHENRLELVHKVITKRYELNKPTVIISNMQLNDLKIDLGDRIWSRLHEEGLYTVEFDWADMRMGN